MKILIKFFDKFLDVAPVSVIDIPLGIFLLAFLTIICFSVFIILLIVAIVQWRNYKAQKGKKSKFVIALSISIFFALLFILGCLLVIPELTWYL
ncbi:MAG: hypothetical protein K6E47_04085 [Lachnospiraceae bacterium]|nr:hypothetical protein [Lachnospiraceae bacterium]